MGTDDLGDKIGDKIEAGAEWLGDKVEGIFSAQRPKEQPMPIDGADDYRKNPLRYYQYLVSANETYIDQINQHLHLLKSELKRIDDLFYSTQKQRAELAEEVREMREARDDFQQDDSQYKNLDKSISKLEEKMVEPDALTVESDVLGKNGKYNIGLLRKKIEYRVAEREKQLAEYTSQRRLAEDWFDYYKQQKLDVIKKKNQ